MISLRFTLIHLQCFLVCRVTYGSNVCNLPKKLKKNFFLIQRQLIELLVFAGFIAKTACVQICRSLLGLFTMVGEMPSLWGDFPKNCCIHKSFRVIMAINNLWMVYFSGVKSSYKHSIRPGLDVNVLILHRDSLSVF